MNNKIMGISDYMDPIEVPDDDLKVNGIKDGQYFIYISDTYLNGYINYVEIIDAYMIRRYKVSEKEKIEKYGSWEEYLKHANLSHDELSWEKSCEMIDQLSVDLKHFHFRHDCDNFDDMLILAKQANSYWYFWKDCDGANSCIGRIPISTFTSDKEAKESLKLEALNLTETSENAEDIDNHIKHIPLGLFRGWITL